MIQYTVSHYVLRYRLLFYDTVASTRSTTIVQYDYTAIRTDTGHYTCGNQNYFPV